MHEDNSGNERSEGETSLGGRVVETIMDDLCDQVLSLENDLGLIAGQEGGNVQPSAANDNVCNQQPDLFQPLSFYDDVNLDVDESLNSLLDSLPPTDNVPSEFSQPYQGEMQGSGVKDTSTSSNESVEAASDVVESVIDKVLETGVVPRKVATVHPFSLNNASSSPETTKTGSGGLRLAGFAVDPSFSTPNSANNPNTTEHQQQQQPRLKLANFAIDPSASSSAGSSSGQMRPSSADRAMFSPGRGLFSPPGPSLSRGSAQMPTLTRAPMSPSVVTAGATPPPSQGQQNLACFGHFERELEYRYCFLTNDYNSHPGYIIFSSLDNVYIKLIVHESGLAGLPREALVWQSVYVKFINEQQSSWCYLTFRTKDAHQQHTIQAELPMDFNHFSLLVQRKTTFILSQSRLNALNNECLSHFGKDIVPSFYHVQKGSSSYLRPNINNLGNECIDPNISTEDRQKTVQWVNTELRAQTGRQLTGRASHMESRVYDRFAKQGQVLFRFIHQYYAEVKKELNAFVLQSRKEPQILELLDPQTALNSPPAIPRPTPPLTQGHPTPPLTPNSSGAPSPGVIRLPPGISIQQQSRSPPVCVKTERNDNALAPNCLPSTSGQFKQEIQSFSSHMAEQQLHQGYQLMQQEQEKALQMRREQERLLQEHKQKEEQRQMMDKQKENEETLKMLQWKHENEKRQHQQEQEQRMQMLMLKQEEERRQVMMVQYNDEQAVRMLQWRHEQEQMQQRQSEEHSLQVLVGQQAQAAREMKSRMEWEHKMKLEQQRRDREQREMEFRMQQQREREMREQREREHRAQLERLRQEKLMQEQRERERERIQRERMMQERMLREQRERAQQEMVRQERMLEEQRHRERQILIENQRKERERILQQERMIQEQRRREEEQTRYLEMQRMKQEEQRMQMARMMQQQEMMRNQDQQHQHMMQQQQQMVQQQSMEQETKFSTILQQQQQQQTSSDQPLQNSMSAQETKFSTILQQQQQQQKQQEPQEHQQPQESCDENPYLRYTQYLQGQEQVEQAQQEQTAEDPQSGAEVKYAHVLQQQQAQQQSAATTEQKQQHQSEPAAEVKYAHALQQQQEQEAKQEHDRIQKEKEMEQQRQRELEEKQRREREELTKRKQEEAVRVKQEPGVDPPSAVNQVSASTAPPQLSSFISNSLPSSITLTPIGSNKDKPEKEADTPSTTSSTSTVANVPDEAIPIVRVKQEKQSQDSPAPMLTLKPLSQLVGPSHPPPQTSFASPFQPQGPPSTAPHNIPMMQRGPGGPLVMRHGGMRPPGHPDMRPGMRPSGPIMRPGLRLPGPPGMIPRPGMRPSRPPMMRPSRPMMRPQMVRDPATGQMMRLMVPQQGAPQPRLARAMAPTRLQQSSILPHLLQQHGPRPVRHAVRPPMSVTRQVLVCPACSQHFPIPETDPVAQFKTNFSCHVLFTHLRAEVETEMGCDDMEVCPADDCPYNIVQLKEDGVPDAESFLIKHYISKHLEVLLPLIRDHPTFNHQACVQTIQVNPGELAHKPSPPKAQGLPNAKLKPIFLDKYFKFARTTAKCPVPAECDPMHVVVFLTQWTSRRNYSLAGVKLLVQWVTEVHSLVDNKPLDQHPRLMEFINTMQIRLEIKDEDVKPPLIDTKKENEFYGDIITNPFDLIRATVCPHCNEKFQHCTKLLYHMLHLHKVNPVHFILKNQRSKPVRYDYSLDSTPKSIIYFSRCNNCEKPCMSPITYALHLDQHLLPKQTECSDCKGKYSSFLKLYSDDICGDNAIPKNVKIFVNNALSKLKFLEEDTEIIGENFGNHFSKYAKRPTINELPRHLKKFKKGSKFRKSKAAYSKDMDINDVYFEMYNYVPETVEEWIINIPTMLDARVSMSIVDREKADTQLEDEFLWEYEDGSTEKIEFEDVSPRKKEEEMLLRNLCTICQKTFATVSDLEQHSAVHKYKVTPEGSKPELLSPGQTKTRARMSLASRLSEAVTTIICADCDLCSEDCDHSDHGIMLRRDSIAHHVANTGHKRCRVATEIRPDTDCKVGNHFHII